MGTTRDILAEVKMKTLPLVNETFLEIFFASPYVKQLEIMEEIRYNFGNELFKNDYFGGEKELWRRRLKTLYDWWMSLHGEQWMSDRIWIFQKEQYTQENEEEGEV